VAWETTVGPNSYPQTQPGCDPVNHKYIGGTKPSYINANCTLSPLYRPHRLCRLSAALFSGAAILLPTARFYCANLLGNAGRPPQPRSWHEMVNVDFSATRTSPIPSHFGEFQRPVPGGGSSNIFNHSNFLPTRAACWRGKSVTPQGQITTNGFMEPWRTQPSWTCSCIE